MASNLSFVVRNGGQSYSAMSRINNGLVIDLSKLDAMRITSVAPGGDTARLVVGAGARLGPVYAFLDRHGFMIPGGISPALGISGLTLGGWSITHQLYQ